MKILGKLLWLATLVLVVGVVYLSSFDDLYFADYSRVHLTDITVEQRLDEAALQELCPNMGVETEEYGYYLVSCTLQNESAVDGYFWADNAFHNSAETSYYSTLESTISTQQQTYSGTWLVPGGETVVARFVLLTGAEDTDVTASQYGSIVAQLQ